MALIRFPVKKSLVTAVVAGLMSLGVAGAAGATPTSGAAPASGTTPTSAPKVNCAEVQADLTRMRHRQSVLDAKVLKLSASGSRAAKAGKAHRAAVVHRNLAHWQRIRAHKINARFLRREAKLAALAAGQCQSATTSTPSNAPAGTTTT